MSQSVFDEFTGSLGSFSGNISWKGNKAYMYSEEVGAVVDVLDDTSSTGVFLGSVKGKKFIPSLALLELLETKQKVVVDQKAAWLYVCGRDILRNGVVRGYKTGGLVLVVNEQDEVLGYGEFDPNQKVAVRNILDIGDYLRRER